MKDKLYNLLAPRSKAIAAFVAAAIVAIAAHFQHVVDAELAEALVGALVTAVVVYLAPKNKPVVDK